MNRWKMLKCMTWSVVVEYRLSCSFLQHSLRGMFARIAFINSSFLILWQNYSTWYAHLSICCCSICFANRQPTYYQRLFVRIPITLGSSNQEWISFHSRVTKVNKFFFLEEYTIRNKSNVCYVCLLWLIEAINWLAWPDLVLPILN